MRAHRFARPWWARRQNYAAGFTNVELAIGVGLIALIMLLVQIESGEISFTTATKVVASKGSSKSSGKKPEFTIALVQPPISLEAQEFVEARLKQIEMDERRLVDVSKAVSHMDPDKAVLLLVGMETSEAAEVLARMDTHYIGHIFDAASHLEAVDWLQELLTLPEYPPIPEKYRRAAEQAGLIEPNEGESLTNTGDPVDGSVDDVGNGIAGGSEMTPVEGAAAGGVGPGGQPSPTGRADPIPGLNVA